MTTQRLIQRVKFFPNVRALDLDLEEVEICAAGSDAQSEILRDCEPIEATGQLTFVIGQEVYTSTDASWLSQAGRIQDPLYYNDQQYGRIIKKPVSFVDDDRLRIAGAGGTKPLPPKYFYVLNTNPKSIGFWYIPDTALVVNVRYMRAHSATDNLNDAGATPVDPLIPDEYEKLLVYGTVVNLFVGREGLEKALATMKALYDFEKSQMRVRKALDRAAPRVVSNFNF